jgi:CO dehydrogenase/acetyl-CoA synthase beta subunit
VAVYSSTSRKAVLTVLRSRGPSDLLARLATDRDTKNLLSGATNIGCGEWMHNEEAEAEAEAEEEEEEEEEREGEEEEEEELRAYAARMKQRA